MKYTKEQYLSCEFWPIGEERDYHAYLITTRKMHLCAACQREIPKHSTVLHESAILGKH